ncbi:GNAT family N-acetyltransferase [Treponema brennaborense]|uniref:GCN5-related N-acetyltransferase n=1 Tax=Treponema brennaborense (strain DSM 12168 / CIP 105900 / DD5/3) TaxID=906968 RepID=F4LPV7_TREBD|nr:GNAT family N-acetyltransferase [Treponema brennaborense]AEE16049.1 GCN5-related N-acetyltransferase [Treponema brennaborense DSM 12168]
MMFALSDELVSQIIFAMENQNGAFVLDAETASLVENDRTLPTDESRYYVLPEWDSSCGFRMMERFVSMQRNAQLKQQLRSVLFSGKGVFRNFKNVLKSFPEAEKQWFAFKEKEMARHIMQWYNTLREARGLEKLGDEPEESEDLVHDDFVFRGYRKDTDEEAFAVAANAIMGEFEIQWPGEIGIALSDLWQQKCGMADPGSFVSIVAETVNGDFAGCVAASPYPSYTRKTVLLTAFFVLQNYRGLGIGKELLTLILAELKTRGVRWVLLADMVIPDFLVPCLLRCGFSSCGGGYIADISANK